jgi:hypothetical protein
MSAATDFPLAVCVPLDDHERLVHVVVRVAEVDHLRARGFVRDLVDVEVELLRPRRERDVEGYDHPLHRALRETELVGDRVGDGALESSPERASLTFHGAFSLPPNHSG